MKVSPLQLTFVAIAGFAAIVLLDILAQYRSNESFRSYMSNLKPEDLIPVRMRRVAEENMETVPTNFEDNEDDSSENDNSNNDES